METTLSEYAQVYVRLMDGGDGYLNQCRWAISAFEKYAGRPILIHELNESLLNGYLASTRESQSPQTRLSRRNILLRLWRHAATNPALQLRPQMPNRDLIGKVRRKSKPPEAWSKEEVDRLLATADRLRGLYHRRKPPSYKISKRLYWRAYILTAWSTGLRRCDLVQLRVSDIPANGRLLIVQQKTGKHVFGQLSHTAMTAVNALILNHAQDKVFPQWCRIPTWRKIARRIVKRAGLRMSIGKIRASAGTNVENRYPGQGAHFLGNTESVFHKHYYDRRQAANIPQPDPLTPPREP